MKSWGSNFIIVNDVIQPMKRSLPNGPWMHHATIQRGLDEYILFRQVNTNKMFLEKVVRNQVNIYLEYIDDEMEWQELFTFCKEAGLFSAASKSSNFELKLHG